jgi:ABC-type transporter Mla MlaB component
LSGLVTPGRPVTFLAAGCQIVVARAGGTFDIALAGRLDHTNRHTVGEVLEVIVAEAVTMRLSLRRLSELDDAGALLLNEIADIASRSHVSWLVVEGSLMWQNALDRLTASATAPPVTTARPMHAVVPRRRRRRAGIAPTT